MQVNKLRGALVGLIWEIGSSQSWRRGEDTKVEYFVREGQDTFTITCGWETFIPPNASSDERRTVGKEGCDLFDVIKIL